MKKSELINEIYRLYPFLEEHQAASLVDQVFANMTQGLAQGKRAEIRGFGSFSSRERKVQLKFSTQADTIELGQKRSIYFRMSKELLDRINIANDH